MNTYESHITVTGLDDREFRHRCERLGVKPVIIEADTGSAGLRQAMTAKFHRSAGGQSALAEMHALADGFGAAVVRRKLELIVGRRTAMPEHLYLEFHLKYRVPQGLMTQFAAAVREAGGHTSRNAMRPAVAGWLHRFATARDATTYRRVRGALADYELLSSIMECVVYDDNPGLDVGWHDCAGCALKPVPAWA